MTIIALFALVCVYSWILARIADKPTTAIVGRTVAKPNDGHIGTTFLGEGQQERADYSPRARAVLAMDSMAHN